MKRERFNELLNNPSEATDEDARLLTQEIEKYPYAQAIRILLAKILFQNGDADKKSSLTSAAIFAANRDTLKKIIQGDQYLESIPEVAVYQDLSEQDQGTVAVNLVDEEPSLEESDSATIFDEVLLNLEKLKSLRKQFLFLEVDEDHELEIKEPDSEIEEAESNIAGSPLEEDESLVEEKSKKKKTKKASKTSPKSKEEKLNEILEKDYKIDSQVNQFFVSEIEKRNDPIVPEKEVSDDQQIIIEKFIQEQPSIGSIKKELELPTEQQTKDLSEKSTKFGDNLVSENLAVILLKQGKKERAIDIYRKLIWKLPQKKAYFAARIEEIIK